jgi:hypothetical protein
MLKWKKDINGYNGHWMGGFIGFDDDCPLYKVGEDDNGWYYDYLPSADGMDGYNTAEEAMAAAEADYQHWHNLPDDFEMEIDSDLLEELATEAEAELQGEGLEIWMNSNIFATYRSDWE